MKKILKKISDRFFKYDLYNKIPSDDILEKQRYRLFTIFSAAGMVVAAGLSWESVSLHLPEFIIWVLTGNFIVFGSNYFALQKHQQFNIAYWIAVLSAFIGLHSLTYFSGGIKDSGMIFFASFILIAFMLLGSKAGKIMFVFAFIHLCFFYYATTETSLVSNLLIGEGKNSVEQDFLITGILALFLITTQINSLTSNKNIVIEKITESRNELAAKNRQLEEYTITLEKKNAELDKFASIVSHDLKAPLRAIGNLTGWIEEDAGESFAPDVRENFNTIKGRVKRMEDLINAILEYSKADRKKSDDVAIDTKALIEDIVEFNGKPDNCTITIQEKMPQIVGDKIKMQQVFANLINNAIKYTDKDQIEIKITSKETKENFEFSIADNGPGIDAQYHEKIFVIFQTLNRRDDVESTGVGLAIVKKIVDEEDGKIWVESEPGKGANFKFIIPKERRKSEITAVAA